MFETSICCDFGKCLVPLCWKRPILVQTTSSGTVSSLEYVIHMKRACDSPAPHYVGVDGQNSAGLTPEQSRAEQSNAMQCGRANDSTMI